MAYILPFTACRSSGYKRIAVSVQGHVIDVYSYLGSSNYQLGLYQVIRFESIPLEQRVADCLADVSR